MYSAFNTLQLELERLLLLQESMTSSGCKESNDSIKLAELQRKIVSHEKATKVLLRAHLAECRNDSNIYMHSMHKLGQGA